MARNIEIKARVADLVALRSRAAALAGKGPIEIAQDDTFFNCPAGRLKLRAVSGSSGELIFYRRSDEHGPKESYYVRTPTSEPETLRQVLALAYGEAGRVRKQRTLFLVGRTRIHLDDVESLGQFIELEVVLRDDEPAEAGVREAEELIKRLGIGTSQLIDRAYVDLLTAGDSQS
jgi:predicted adenylyl cyclase CyaB